MNKDSFFKKSAAIIIFTLAVFTAAVIFIVYAFFHDAKKNDTDAEFISYERYVKNYIEELKSDISAAANSNDLKDFIETKNNENLQKFFDYYMKKNNCPETIYLFDANNECIFFTGNSGAEKEAFEFAADGNEENVYISDFFVDKFTDSDYILFGKNLFYKNSEFKLIFSYNSDSFKDFFIKTSDESFFAVLFSDAETFVNFGKYEDEDIFFTEEEFIELSNAIKKKTIGTDYLTGRIENLSSEESGGNILVQYKTISSPDLILISLEKKENVFIEAFLLVIIFFVVFSILITSGYSKIIKGFYLNVQKSKEEMESAELTITEQEFTKTKIPNIDLYINKIKDLCGKYKNILYNIKNAAAVLNTNIGIIEIVNDKNIAVYSPEAAFFVGAGDMNANEDINKTSIEDYLSFKEKHWIIFEHEKNVYCVEKDNIKKWVKVYYYDEKETKAIIIDVSDYIIKKYNDILDTDFDYATNLFKNEVFMKKTDEYIKKNKPKFGCFASAEASHYAMINELFGEYIANKYLSAIVSSLSRFFDGYFAGIKNKGKIILFIYSEKSRKDIKTKFHEWEEKNSNILFTAPGGRKFKIKCIIGYACYPEDADNIDNLFKYSEFALYETKRLYRDSIHSFAIENYNRDMFMETQTKALDRLIDENRAIYHFQPIVNVNNCSIYGYEALLRTDDGIFSTPLDVINLALSEGKAYLLEEMNVSNCLKILKNNPSVFDNKRLFLNSIATNTLTKEDLENIRNKYKDVSHLAVYELSTMFADNQTVINKSQIFNRLGTKFAIDRFGGKYTDDFSLLSGGPEFVKIDKSLILDIHLKKEEQSHVMKIIKYAEENNINVIAVGIETYDDLVTVIKLGVKFIQGYYISLPESTFLLEIRESLKREIKDALMS